MTARSTYPIREGFFIDEGQELIEYLGGPLPLAPVGIGSVRTTRVIVLGATPGPGYWFIRVTFRSKLNEPLAYNIDFFAEDFDANGVGIAHFRCPTDKAGKDWYAYYSLFGDAGVQKVYLDAVENIA